MAATISDEVIKVQFGFTPKSCLAGWAYCLLNDTMRAKPSFEAARIFLEAILGGQPDDPRVPRSLGNVYANLRRKAEVIREGKDKSSIFLNPPISRVGKMNKW